ncbi:MAG: AMP-binding protein [Actinomycetia bacterium]|nr:AMP-binding protein [Actinomycetes bacterium]
MQAETLYQWLKDVATRYREHVALVSHEAAARREWTYLAFVEAVERAAGGLQALGYGRGQALAVWLPNTVEWLVMEFAGAMLGLLVVPLNTRYRAHELGHLLRLSRARGLVFMPRFLNIDFAGILEEVLSEDGSELALEHVFVTGTDPSAVRVGSPAKPVAVHALGEVLAGRPAEEEAFPHDLVNVFGTSGTTSAPKLAAHDQASIVRHAEAMARAFALGEGERTLGLLPFCGVYGFCAAFSVLAAGGTLIPVPAFDARRVAALMADESVTFQPMSHIMLRQILDLEDFDFARLRSWTRGTYATLNRPQELAERAFRTIGVRLTNVYGSSEAFAMMTHWPWDDPLEQRSLPGGHVVSDDIRVRAVDLGTGAVLPPRVSGEIQLQGYNVLTQYLGNPNATAEAFTPDGWFRTGDQGYVLDDRTFVLENRLKDTIRLRGFLVSPTEIEEFLLQHPAVEMAQVVGVNLRPEEDDVAVAFVKRKPGQETTEEALRLFCKERLASFKLPSRFVFVEEYPMTPSANGDKVQKVKLREWARAILTGAEPSAVTKVVP